MNLTREDLKSLLYSRLMKAQQTLRPEYHGGPMAQVAGNGAPQDHQPDFILLRESLGEVCEIVDELEQAYGP